jgi:hypothetical protein
LLQPIGIGVDQEVRESGLVGGALLRGDAGAMRTNQAIADLIDREMLAEQRPELGCGLRRGCRSSARRGPRPTGFR